MNEYQFDEPTMMIQLTLDEMDSYPRLINGRSQNRGDPWGRFPTAPIIVELTYEQIAIINTVIQKVRELPAENPETHIVTSLNLPRLSKLRAWCYYINREMKAYRIFTEQLHHNTQHIGTVRLRGELAITLSYIGLYHRANDGPERPMHESIRYYMLWLGLVTRLHTAINVSGTSISAQMYNWH